VTDTGCGIAVEDHQRLFEPFFTTHGRGDGRGLELTVALGALQAVGGIIAVTSERGKGATFTAYWPLLEHEAIQEAARPLATAPAPRPGSILVIDDEACVGHMLERLLSRRGHRVTAVTDFASALSCFGQNPHLFDLIMLDQVMPGMKGLDLAPQLHQIRPDIPISACAGCIVVTCPT
jgi:hypothetical protein